MAILNKPSRSYANVDHDPDGLSAVGSAPFARQGDKFKTYRPSLVETHLKRPALYDPHPNSSFSPLPPAFNLSSRHRKDQELAGKQAELDHILQPGYKSPRPDQEPDSASIAGPSRLSSNRTAGGFAAKAKSKAAGLGIRHSASTSTFSTAQANGRAGGVYIDSKGKMHDTEYDPFGGVSEINRRKTRRRSAFGADRHKGSGSESSSASGSEVGAAEPRKSFDETADEERRKQEVERRRFEEVSGLQAARRRSMASDRPNGRGTPSIRSSEDSLHTGTSSHFDRRLRPQQGYYIPSPLSPTFNNVPNTGSSFASRTLATTAEEEPEKTTESTEEAKEQMPPPPPSATLAPPAAAVGNKPKKKKPAMSVSVHDKKITVTGFDAPVSATRTESSRPETPQDLISPMDSLRIPGSARSVSSRRSSESARSRPPKPPTPQPEDLYPMTPAQLKRHQERERRSALGAGPRSYASGYDLGLASSGRGRALPEIEIVEDDDPRIVFPEHGRTTRVQTTHDHVIRGPFSLAMSAQGGGSPSVGFGEPSTNGGRRPSGASFSARSVSKAPSTIIEEGQGGYLPSRWASGDHDLRLTEDAREKYRPREWGGKSGDLGGRPEEWRPTTKEQIKRNLKDVSTNARFSMFRAKQKLLRKADM